MLQHGVRLRRSRNRRTQQYVHYFSNIEPPAEVVAEAKIVAWRQRPYFTVSCLGHGFLVLIEWVLGDWFSRVWPHEKPGKYLKYSQDISPKTNKVYLYGMAWFRKYHGRSSGARGSPSLTVGQNLPTYLSRDIFTLSSEITFLAQQLVTTTRLPSL